MRVIMFLWQKCTAPAAVLHERFGLRNLALDHELHTEDIPTKTLSACSLAAV